MIYKIHYALCSSIILNNALHCTGTVCHSRNSGTEKLIPINSWVRLTMYMHNAWLSCTFHILSSYGPFILISTILWRVGRALHRYRITALINHVFNICFSVVGFFLVLFSYIFIYIITFYSYMYITNSQCDQLPVGLIAQLVEHCTGIAEVMGSNPIQA